MELWRHQKLALERYAGADGFGLLFDCGLGKTATAARIAEAKGLPVLVIAPDALCQQWAEELTSKDPERRITTKDWEVLVCSSRSKNTKRFRTAFATMTGVQL